MTDTYVLLGILNEHAPKMPLGVAHTVAEKIVDTFRPVIAAYQGEATRQRNLHDDACVQLKRHTETIMSLNCSIDSLENENVRLNRMLQDERRRTAPPAAVVEVVSVPHAALVRIALSVPEITNAIKEDRKIVAIKHLRNLVSCGLKEAKNAIDEAVGSVIR